MVKMAKLNKHRLIAFLIVKSVNNKNILIDYQKWSKELATSVSDVLVLFNHLRTTGEVHILEIEGQEYVCLFGNSPGP